VGGADVWWALEGTGNSYLVQGSNWWGVWNGGFPVAAHRFTTGRVSLQHPVWLMDPAPFVSRPVAMGTIDVQDVEPPQPPFTPPWPLRLVRLDLETGAIQPYVAPEFEGVKLWYVLLAHQGPFARAIRGGACTEVRSAPAVGAAALECAANGVLFQRSAPPTVDGAWLGVTTPAGVVGWAETRYLEW
jgi:hypothetical protein